jgi:competence protein ComEA
MSPAERKVLLTLLGLIVAGHGVRTWILNTGEAPGSVTLLQPAGEDALARQREAARQAARPLAPGERIDLNTATAGELDRLPRVGPALARRIVADREANGPYRTLADLDRVSGIGPALLRELAGHVTQGEGRAEAPGERGGAELVNVNTAGEAELLRLPGIGPAKARAIIAYRQARGSFASVAELSQVPGIGPATVARLAGLATVR